MKRSGRLRPKSKRRAHQDRLAANVLREFAAEFPNCWCCGETTNLEIHHAAGRKHRDRHNRAGLIRLCRDCHRLITESRIRNPLAFCLAMKWVHDRAFYDRARVLELCGKAESFVTEREVWSEVKAIRKEPVWLP